MDLVKDKRYCQLINNLRSLRKSKPLPQRALAQTLDVHQSYIAKVEGFERRLDILELANWSNALGADLTRELINAGFVTEKPDNLLTASISDDSLIQGISSILYIISQPFLIYDTANKKSLDITTSAWKILDSLSITPDDLISEHFADFIKKNPSETGEECKTRLIHLASPDSNQLLLNCTLTCINTPNGSYLLVSMEDISPKVAAELALGQQKHLTREIINSLPYALYIKDLHGKYTLSNSQFHILTGLTQKEVTGHSDTELFPAEISKHSSLEDQKVLNDGATIYIERWQNNLTDSGSKRRYRITKSPLRDSNDHLVGTIGTIIDITSEIDNDAYQSELNARFLEIFKNTPIPVLISSFEDGLIIDANESFLKLVGHQLKEIVGVTSVAAGFMPLDRRVEIRNALETSDNYEIQHQTFLTKSGITFQGTVKCQKVTLGSCKYLISVACQDVFLACNEHEQPPEATQYN